MKIYRVNNDEKTCKNKKIVGRYVYNLGKTRQLNFVKTIHSYPASLSSLHQICLPGTTLLSVAAEPSE